MKTSPPVLAVPGLAPALAARVQDGLTRVDDLILATVDHDDPLVAQASAGDVQRLVDQIRRERVEAIFPESSVNPDIERAIAREAGARIGDSLYADSLGPRGSAGETYEGALAHDARALVSGMSGGRVDCAL